MTKPSETILFFGNEQLATGVNSDRPSLRALQQAGYEVIEITSKEPNAQELLSHDAKAGVLAAYGTIISRDVLDLFPCGIINIHPSLLPLYRGSSPIESAMLDGAAETGVSLMKLVAEMDAGPIYAQEKVSLRGDETKQALANELSELGSRMLVKHLPAILNGSLRPRPQADNQATYTKRLSKDDSILDWNKPAQQLEREVRAYAGWPRSRTRLGKVEVIITQVHAVPSKPSGAKPGEVETLKQGVIMVHTADGYLCIDSMIPSGKKEMSAAAFLAGYQLP